jgi:hypothetical protein
VSSVPDAPSEFVCPANHSIPLGHVKLSSTHRCATALSVGITTRIKNTIALTLGLQIRHLVVPVAIGAFPGLGCACHLRRCSPNCGIDSLYDSIWICH